MIKKFVVEWEKNKSKVKAIFDEKHPDEYIDVVRAVIQAISDENQYSTPSPDRIHIIDDGDYQGTLLFIIGATGCQPDKYWSVLVAYGSCSGCDTLCGIRGYSREKPTEQQVEDYMTLALHIVQGLRAIGGEVV